MINIIVVLPKLEDAKGVRGLLIKNGFQVTAVCTTGAQALSQLDDLNDGIIICGYKLTDMIYQELHDCLPKGFDMLLMVSQNMVNDCMDNDIICLSMPLKVYDLINTVDMMSQAIQRRRRKAKQTPKVRSAEETALIREAKQLLMNRNNMTEEEAHRYIQKCSMDSGTNMVETAQMVLAMMRS
ncbi:MAG: ANTAR domain-containing protein [Clostridiales bacterium]|nr:ANTAR domain-containing protein [Clostridiales bacterium]